MLKYIFLVIVFSFSYASAAQPNPAQKWQSKLAPKTSQKNNKKPETSTTIPLVSVVKAVEMVVNAYNSRPDTQGEKPALPPLATADFDFKTVAETKGGPSVNFLIFKAGYTHDKQKTNEVDFQYTPHAVHALDQATLSDELSKAIEAAAKQIKGEAENGDSPGSLELKQFTVTLGFSIAKDYNGGLSIPIHLVTLGGSLDYTSSSVQQVKLAFVFPDKKGSN
ncbi:MAG: trypco2 family protein [Terriglobales bacterium]